MPAPAPLAVRLPVRGAAGRAATGALLALALGACGEAEPPRPEPLPEPLLGAALAAASAATGAPVRRTAANGARLAGDWSCVAVERDGSVRRERTVFAPDGEGTVIDDVAVRRGRWSRNGDTVVQRFDSDGARREAVIRRLDRDALRFAVGSGAPDERVHHCTDAALAPVRG